MKKIKFEVTNEEVFYEKLDNGLDVYFYIKPDYHNNYVTFTTKFGSIYNEFVPDGENKIIKVPNGIAHFLEHKVFAQKEDPQPMDYYAISGTNANAYTTYKNTTYLFEGPNNLKNNILYLLDYVQEPYFTEENIESEKGIIEQEINMCKDRPGDILFDTIRRVVFHNNPFKNNIIGEVNDIQKINKDLLTSCYNTFYNPKNMFLIVAGNFDKEEILSAIKENQKQKMFSDIKEFSRKKYFEPDKVVKDNIIVNKDVAIPKAAYAIKISQGNRNLEELRKFDLYLYIFFSILFDETSDFYQMLKEKEIVTSALGIEFLNCDSHFLAIITNSTNKYSDLFKEIEKYLKNYNITKEDFERKKKVLISNEVFSFENIGIVSDMIIDSILFNNMVETDAILKIREFTLEEMLNLINKTNLNNKTTVVVKKE